jgi:hypothetical protein
LKRIRMNFIYFYPENGITEKLAHYFLNYY